jgi:hypothetical protein
MSDEGFAGSTMTPNTTPLERAFEIAKSGRCRTTDDIFAFLKKEGYPTEQIVGPWLLRQLRTVINEFGLTGRGS